MKTLDEVIKALEKQLGVGGEDAIENCLETDALHYLKHLQEYYEMSEMHDYSRLEPYNPPLTWDELRKMEGKPVWIDSVPLVRRWVIIKKFHPIGGNKNLFDMEVEDGAHFLRKDMGRDANKAWWQAYRKEK